MAFADEQLAASYLMRRLESVRAAQQLPASAQFDLARSPMSDDELEQVVDQFRDSPQPSNGWGFADGLQQVLSSQPKRIPVDDLSKLQNNLVAQGYAPPGAEANGAWDPSWYASFRRWDRDNYEAQRAGRHWYSAPIESGVRAITNTMPSRVFQGIVGAAKGMVLQTPETFERGGALGGAATGAAIGGALGSVIPGAGTLAGAGVGAAVGGTVGFLADLFGNDQGEEDQSGAERLLDALQPFNEYAQQGPKAFFEDLGYVLSATSMITGAGAAVKGVAAGAAAISAARAVPTLAADGTLAAGNVLAAGAEGAGSTTIQAATKAPLLKTLLTPGAEKELGAFGTIARAAARRSAMTPGTVGALENTMLRYSPVAFMQRLGPNVALKAFTGLSQAQMGARLFGGIGQGSTGDFEEAKTVLEAKYGRDLTEPELENLAKTTGQTAIEKAIANAPKLETGIDIPLLGDLADVASFFVWPEKLLPFRGAKVAKSAVNLMGDTALAPYAHAIQSQAGVGLRDAVRQAKETITPLDNAWMRADYGIHVEAAMTIERARLSPEKAFRTNAMANARADVIRTIKAEAAGGGRSETLERIMGHSVTDPTDFTSWLVGLNGKHRGLDRLTSWKKANELARKTEQQIEDQLLLQSDDGLILKAEALLPNETLDLPNGAGAMVRPGETKSVKARSIVHDKAASNVDRMSIEDRINRLERRAQLYISKAEKGTTDPWVTVSLREQARLARSEAETLRGTLKSIDAAGTKRYVRVNITPARVEFADRATIFSKREEFLKLRDAVLNTAENPNAHVMARQELANYVDQLAQEGFIPDALVTSAKAGKPSDRIARTLEEQARHAARPIELPDELARQFDELGYKAVETGEDVLFPHQLEQMTEVTGIGDYTRRAQVWETLGMSPQWRSDRSLFRLRRQHELSELTQVFEENGIKLNADQAMRRLHDKLKEINHDGAVFAAIRKPKQGRAGLYKVDVRDLSPDDVLRAFEDVPGFNDETAIKVFGALRRGAAYGGEVKLLHPVDSARAIGAAMRVNGLPGFSDAIRTWHSEVPMKLSRRAWNRDEFVYRPDADMARSPERARAVAGLKTVADKARVSNSQRDFGLMMLDSLGSAQVKAGRFASIDDFYKHLDVGYAERYVAGDLSRALFRTRSDDELRFLINTFKDQADWYERSTARLADIFHYGTKTVLPLSPNGQEIDDLDLFSQILAATSPRTKVDENMDQALGVFQVMKKGEADWGSVPGVMRSKWKMLDDIASGRHILDWTEATEQGVYKVNSAKIDGKMVSGVKGLPKETRERMKVWNFYQNLRGDLDKVTVDTWMGSLFDAEVITPAIYDNIERDIRQLAKDTGMYPAQAQAALWAAAKEELGNTALKDAKSFAELSEPLQRYVEKNLKDVNPYALMQRVNDEVLGATQYGEDFPTIMRFFRNADFATLVHENAHLLRRMLPEEDVDILERAYGIRGPKTPHGPSQELRDIAREYHEKAGIPFDRSAVAEYADVDPERAKRIADAFDNMKPTPGSPATKRAYKAFVSETMAQYDLLKSKGYRLIPWGGKGGPYGEYGNAGQFIADVRDNKTIYYFKTLQDDAFGAGKVTKEQIAENPLLADAKMPVLDSEGNRYDQTYNDIFRAVHDIFGHAKEGVETGARGEENAWRQHARMYSPEARKAMTTETRGQNSFVNFGPHLRRADGSIPQKGEPGFVPPQERPYADQKVGLLPDEFTQVDPSTNWSTAAEEQFARDAERYFFQKVVPGHARGAFDVLREAIGSLYKGARPAGLESNLVPREAREVFDKYFGDALKAAPPTRKRAAATSLASKQVIGGAAIGAGLGATQGDDPGDILKGALYGAAAGLGTRAALKRSYGYLPDYLTRLNTALRYTLSFTFDAGRYSEQNLIAMTKHKLPPMLSPRKYTMARTWSKSPFSRGEVTGETAWKHAIQLFDEINGTTWFQNIDDLDRRMFQTGMLGFSPRNWEVAQAWQLYQRGMSSEKIKEAVSEIGRYGLGRTAAEKSANFIVFPFSFSKKLLTDIGDFMLQAPGRNLILHEGFRRYHESEADEKVQDFLDRRAPLLKQIAQINNLAFGVSPGRFFLQGLSDQRTNVGKAMQIIASVFVPSGAATPLAQAAGGLGDLAIHAFSPIVVTGESLSRAGGVNNVQDIFKKYIPFVRELDQYFTGDQAAIPAQIKAITEGAEPYYQFSKYQDGLRLAKAEYEPLAAIMGYSSVDGLMSSDMGQVLQQQLASKQTELADEFPTGFAMSQSFENSDALNERALLDLANKSNRSEGEDHILQLAEESKRFETMNQILGLDPDLMNAILAKKIRDSAMQYVGDARFAELYDRFFLRTYGPIRRVA